MKSSVTSRKQRFWALLLAVVMVVGLLPTAGVNAANYDLDDNTYASAFNGIDRLKGGEDTIFNANGPIDSSVRIFYYDVDGTTLLGSATKNGGEQRNSGGTYTILEYTDAVRLGQANQQLQGNTISDYWKVEVSYSGTVGSGGTIDVKLVALPKYTLNWFQNGGKITFTDDSALPTSFTPGDKDISLAPKDFKWSYEGYTFTGWKVSNNSVGQANDNVVTINDNTLATLDSMDAGQNPTTLTDYSISLNAQWTDNSYTLTFNNNIPTGEAESAPTADITGIPYHGPSTGSYYVVALPNEPVKADSTNYTHYVFDGWSVNTTPTPSVAPHNKTVGIDTLINEYGADVTTIPMIANWTAKNYTIKMDYDAPAAVSLVPANPADQVKPYGTGATSTVSIAATMNPGVTSHTFAGWSLKKGAATADYTADTDVKTLVDAAEAAGVTFGSTSAAANNKDTLTLYGVWTPVNKTVSFNKNGHGDDVSDQTVPYGSLAAEPTPVPSEKGYDFKGWFEDDGTFANQWDFLKNTVTSDKTLYAQWVQKKYNLVFDTNTTGLTTPPTAVKPGDINGLVYTDNANLPVLTDTSGAYNFLGWGCTATATAADFNTTAPVLVGNIVDKYPAASIVINGDGTNSIALYAIWTKKPVYTVTWKDYDGTVLKSDNLVAGTVPAYTGTPTRAADATNTYTFSGWNDGTTSYAATAALPGVTANVTYTAEYTATGKTYNITWKNDDGTVLKSELGVNANTIPAYTGTPTKVADATNTYTFSGWNDGTASYAVGTALPALTVDVTYTAEYTAVPITYTVTWKDYNGTILKTDAGLAPNTIPAYTGTPTRATDAANTYTFSGWNDGAASYAVGTALPALVADTTYTAYYSASVRNYTITWKDGDGNTLGTTKVAYGDVPTYTLAATPTKTATASTKYTFNNSWSPALTAVTGDATYTAQFTSTNVINPNPNPNPNPPAPTYYTITWIDGDNNLIYTEQVAEGSTPVYNKAKYGTPTKNPTGYATYSFNNTWSPAITKVTGNQEYVAQFDMFGPEGGQENPTPSVTPEPTTTPKPTSTPAPAAPAEYDIEYYEELPDGTEVQLKKTNNPDKYTYGVGAEIKYGIDKEGYTFEGWYSKRSKKYVKKVGTKTKGTVKLYAIFVPDDSGNGNEGDNGKGLPTDFSTLFVRLIDYTENSMTLKWEKMEYVDGYDILGSRCNSKDVIRPYEPIVSVDADTDEYVMSDLLAKTYYKFYVRAFILVNGEKRYITTSINVHGVTLNDTYGVADELEIEKVVAKYINGKSKTKYVRSTAADDGEINITLKVGQSLKIVTSEYNRDGKEIRAHRPISFESSDPAICKIGKKSSHKYGVVVADKANTYKSHTITALAAGECDIYVFAQNGVYKTIHVTVK